MIKTVTFGHFLNIFCTALIFWIWVDFRDAMIISLVINHILSFGRLDNSLYTQANMIGDITKNLYKMGLNFGSLIDIYKNDVEERNGIPKEGPKKGPEADGKRTLHALRSLREDGYPGQPE